MLLLVSSACVSVSGSGSMLLLVSSACVRVGPCYYWYRVPVLEWVHVITGIECLC